MGGAPLGTGRARRGASIRVSRGGGGKGPAQRELKEGKGILGRGGGRRGRGRRRDHLGTGARAPRVHFCSSPIWSPQTRARRQNRGGTKCTFIQLRTQTPRVQEDGSLGRRRGGAGGAVPGNSAGQGVGPRTPGAGGPSPCVGDADGLFGGSSLPRPGEGQQGAAAPASGWAGRLIPGSAPSSAKLGSPPPPPGPPAPTLRQGQQWGAEAGFTLRHLLGLERGRDSLGQWPVASGQSIASPEPVGPHPTPPPPPVECRSRRTDTFETVLPPAP